MIGLGSDKNTPPFWVNVSISDHDDEKGKDAKNKEKWQQWLQLSSSDQWWCWRWWWWCWRGWRWALQQLQLAQVVHFLTSALSHTWGYPPHRLLRGRPSNQNPIKTSFFRGFLISYASGVYAHKQPVSQWSPCFPRISIPFTWTKRALLGHH